MHRRGDALLHITNTFSCNGSKKSKSTQTAAHSRNMYSFVISSWQNATFSYWNCSIIHHPLTPCSCNLYLHITTMLLQLLSFSQLSFSTTRISSNLLLSMKSIYLHSLVTTPSGVNFTSWRGYDLIDYCNLRIGSLLYSWLLCALVQCFLTLRKW